MKLAVRVQHHPARVGLLDRLVPLLAGLDVEVVSDPDPDGFPSPWRTYRECLSRPWDGTHMLIVQDDCLPCDGFADRAIAAVGERRDDVVAMFVQGGKYRKQMLRAASLGQRWAWLMPTTYVPVVATCWPREHADRVPGWVDEWAEKNRWLNTYSDDGAAHAYCKAHGLLVWATVPSLVEHPDDVPSLIGTKRHKDPASHRTAIVPPC